MVYSPSVFAAQIFGVTLNIESSNSSSVFAVHFDKLKQCIPDVFLPPNCYFQQSPNSYIACSGNDNQESASVLTITTMSQTCVVSVWRVIV